MSELTPAEMAARSRAENDPPLGPTVTDPGVLHRVAILTSSPEDAAPDAIPGPGPVPASPAPTAVGRRGRAPTTAA